jgi:hypothetical protein
VQEADLTKRVRALKKDLDERTDSGSKEVLLWPFITNVWPFFPIFPSPSFSLPAEIVRDEC